MSRNRFKPLLRRLLLFAAILGPGLITASADNDASGIATYSLAGSSYGYAFLWLIVWVTLGEVVVQEMAARMGVVTGKGLTDLIREEFGPKTTLIFIVGLVIANLGTTVAQFAGLAAVAEMFGLSRYIAVPIGALAVWFLVYRGSYQNVEKVMLVLCLTAFAYVISGIMVKPPWGEVLRSAVVPSMQFERAYIMAVLATIGTTMTPWGCAYLQASVADKGVKREEYLYTKVDVVFGAILGNVVSAFVIISTASVLHSHGIVVDSAEKAAMALEPLAGAAAKYLFGVGLLGASLLSAMVLPLATTYAVSEAFGWERGVSSNPEKAPSFYRLYTTIIIISALIVLIPGMPLFTIMWVPQAANALLLPFTLVLMLKLANNTRLMGSWRNKRWTNVTATLLLVLVSAAGIALLVGS
ncbi:MAG: Nramp family divalent metal transporter [Chloroflexi bacterium]|nr:Nramp family divalent metal transporter [Chloroflexota bacterium]